MQPSCQHRGSADSCNKLVNLARALQLQTPRVITVQQAKATVEVSNVLEKAASHANTLRDAADQLYHQHNDPFLIRAPAHDVPTALDVLQTGMHPDMAYLSTHTDAWRALLIPGGCGLRPARFPGMSPVYPLGSWKEG